ncbi:helix-turn-helix domain-containing protein [Micromonospora sp. NPDC006431]|uniref:AraC-like ligand-binding domain-containing protein n=1 Tax=Micromonospora sp. NPDC006431 TaxID=3364235 RepID=UPI0036D1956F
MDASTPEPVTRAPPARSPDPSTRRSRLAESRRRSGHHLAVTTPVAGSPSYVTSLDWTDGRVEVTGVLPTEVLDTSLLPPADRFACWYEVVSQEAAPTHVRCPHIENFTAVAKRVDLGSVRLAELHYPTLETIRSPRLVRKSQPDTYQLVLMTTGSSVAIQDRTESPLGPSSFTLLDNTRPFTGSHFSDGPVLAGSISLLISRQSLPLHPDRVRRLLATSIPSDTGMAALLAQFVQRLVTYPEQFAASDAPRLGMMALDLAAGALAQQLEVQGTLPVDVRERTLRAEIRAFIEKNLGDSELNPTSVAAAHHISLRTLHRLFEQEDHTVAGLIRQRRLDRCRRDLINPRLAHQAIQRIAARWGFADKAHFSRLFKACYGMSPQEYREQHRQL